jgi:hypothetical protein
VGASVSSAKNDGLFSRNRAPIFDHFMLPIPAARHAVAQAWDDFAMIQDEQGLAYAE